MSVSSLLMHAWLPTPSQHFLWIAGSLLIYVGSTRLANIRRPPASAIAWVMGLVLLPYVWLPLFLLFGRRKLRMGVSAPVEHVPHIGQPAHWATEMIGAFGLPGPVGAQTRFHADGKEALEALWQCVEGAQKTLDVCTFLVANDAVGKELVSRLALKAKQGVRVRLLVDGAGVWIARHPSFRTLCRAGGKVALFHPLLGLRHHGSRNLRNHRKCVIADEALLWSGGRNMAVEYFCGDAAHPQPWVDLSFDMKGPIAAIASQQFEMDWSHAHGAVRLLHETQGTDARPSTALAQLLPSGPDQAEDTAHAILIAACFQAKKRLVAVTPYFVPDEALLSAMRLAARRGVEVKLVLPLASNHLLADFVRSRSLRILASAGVHIHVAPYMLHAKAVVVDDDFALTGSVNLDVRSLLLNYELAMAFYGKTEVAWLSAWIEGICRDTKVWHAKPAGLLRDLAEGLLLTLAFQL